MSEKQVKVKLMVTADTEAAKQNIQSLQNALQSISINTSQLGITPQIQQGVTAARQLQSALQEAVNVNTGKLDLTKLTVSLKKSGTDLQTMSTQLQSLGPVGQRSFLQLARAVSQAEVPLRQSNSLLSSFMTTLANTVRWQIATKMIQGVTGAFQEAVSHAKDFNAALNDIQIVTLMSNATLANFAETAHKAAQELGTTAEKFAEAALIFYQQGLDGSAVEERASVVIKLAQVTGESASTVSDQMTAIWNNFDDGSKTLEYYADVLTKLGAATASSTDEISEGMEKFASVAETVGLSYETASSAIATVVANTRQSADVVGTALILRA